MQDVIFREYDIRGKVGQDFLVERTYQLAQALACYFINQNPETKKIAVAMDGRTHSPIIKERLVDGLLDAGLDVEFIGMCPSPALYFALHTRNYDAGIMITASHNPKEYNGLKLCLGTQSMWGGQVKEVRDLFKQNASWIAADKGAYTEASIRESYISYLVREFSHLRLLKMPMVIDCGNGMAGTVIPELLNRLEWQEYELLYPEVDGSYPNHEADPTVYNNMIDLAHRLEQTKAVLGVGFDGDCDRMAAMTRTGYLIPGDKLLSLFASELLKKYPGRAVVCDVKSSQGLIDSIGELGGQAVMSPAGHAIVKEYMQRSNAIIGGELSCHFVFNDRYFGFDDGIYAFLRLCELLVERNDSLDNLLAAMPTWHSSQEFRIPCSEEQKETIINHALEYFQQIDGAHFTLLDGMRVQLPYGWGLVRASNTQAMISLRFESSTTEGFNRLGNDFIALLKLYVDVSVLQQAVQAGERA